MVGQILLIVAIVEFIGAACMAVAIGFMLFHWRSHRQEREWLRELYDLHKVYDDSGIPLWYVPRSWVENQEQLGRVMLSSIRQQKALLQMIRKGLEESQGGPTDAARAEEPRT